jgi:hypothetical protein
MYYGLHLPEGLCLCLCRRADRLDWMYAGSLAAKEDAAKRQEEALLGQRAATVLTDGPTAEGVSRVGAGCCYLLQGSVSRRSVSRPAHPWLQCEVASALPSVHATATPASMNEEWNRLNNDPLLLVSNIRSWFRQFAPRFDTVCP